MHQQMSVRLADFRYVSIDCPHCHTRVVLDLSKKTKAAQDNDFFAPKDCPGCRTSYDSAIRPNLDRLQKAYEGLVEIADRLSFFGE